MPKLAPTDVSVYDFLDAVVHDGRREDATVLLDLFQRASGFEPRMWGPTIVGFGAYHYRYASGHEGDAPLAAFSPRQANMVVYIAPGLLEANADLAELGKHRATKGCLYFGRLTNIDLGVLMDLVVESIELTVERYTQGQ